MIVVGHQAPRMHLPAGLLAGLAQALEESGFGFFRPKNIRPVVSPVQDVIHSGFGFHAQRSGHRPVPGDALGSRQPQTPRPDPFGSF